MIGRIPTPWRSRNWLLLLIPVLIMGTSAVVTAADAAVSSHSPVGRIDVVAQLGNGIRVAGWAIDPDTHAPIRVEAQLDGRATRVVADIARPDVATAHPGFGAQHGFDTRLAAPAGTRTVCVYALNAGAGASVALGCRTITVNFSPFGAITAVTPSPGGFTATGWAIDHDQPRPALAVALTVDASRIPATANLPRADVAARYPSAGAAHGFSIVGHANEGVRRICVVASNIGLGADAQIACVTVTLNSSPVGAVTAVMQIPGGFRAQGWATDPDTAAPVTVTVLADGKVMGSTIAARVASTHTGHVFDVTYLLGAVVIPPGTHNICASGVNLGAFGHTREFGCKAVTLNYNPAAAITSIKQLSPGYQVSGWVRDPDRSGPAHVLITTDGVPAADVIANRVGATQTGHNFVINLPAGNGQHQVCAVAVNMAYGNADSAASCVTVTLNFNPSGALDKLMRIAGSKDIRVIGWAVDPDSTKPTPVRVSIDGLVVGTPIAASPRADVAATHPGFGPAHGLSALFPTTPAEHRICASAVNVLGGTGDTALGCRIIIAVHPVVPSAPRTVVARGGYGSATITWAAPASDGGAPWTSFTVLTAGHSVTVGAGARTATIAGLASGGRYAFSVVATNVAGRSAPGRAAVVTTASSPPPQTTPAPISTSRYTRNIIGSSSAMLSQMRAEGVSDARANVSGHSYIVLLDIGGQASGGVVLSAGVRFVSYGDLVRTMNAYVDGYASTQRPNAPVTIALGTNNDMDVSAASGAVWARSVVNPVASHAAVHPGMKIAGANDFEPGFRGTYAQSKAWLLGYLGASGAPFVFNGSADGCAWTATARGCNNGWTMSGLYYLSGGAAPTRIVNLPQIYNNTMAAQWKYISLTGVGQRQPKINFGGALTEWTACAQAGGCGSLTGRNAWIQMWNQLQSHPSLRITSLPFSTDLRIDR
jgi:hypothetical protein